MLKTTFFLVLVGRGVLAADSYGVGQKDFVLKDSTRNRTISTHVWYPTDPKATLEPQARKGNPFIPVLSAKDAPIVAEKFPVVLLSHGSGGKAEKLFWLTDRLVRSGMIVVGVDHQGNMTGDNSADGMMRVWNRPVDLTLALDKVKGMEFFQSRLDLNRVAAVGHSAGGTTVLLLGGARLSAKKLTSPIPNCAGTKEPYFAKTCDELKNIDLKAYPKETVEANYTDSRVKAIVSLDPGLVRSFNTDSFKTLKNKTLVFLADKLNTPHDEILAKEFAKYLPSQIVPDSYHMTFIQACRPDFPKDDAELVELCVENEQKLLIQKKVADQSVEFFQKTWDSAKL